MDVVDGLGTRGEGLGSHSARTGDSPSLGG